MPEARPKSEKLTESGPVSPRRRPKVSAKCALAIGLSVLASCRELNPNVPPEQLQTAVVQFDDLPVPRELKIRSGVGQSWSWQAGAYRNAKLEYKGPASIDSVRRFLEERLPAHGWRRLSDERPTQERIVQKWLSEARSGVNYFLDVELIADGPSSHLYYNMWTKRRWAGSVRASDAASSDGSNRNDTTNRNEAARGGDRSSQDRASTNRAPRK